MRGGGTVELRCGDHGRTWLCGSGQPSRMGRVSLPAAAEPAVTLFRLECVSTSTAQNTKRNANCMNRGVVSVDTYLPNWVGSNESDG